MTRPNNVLPYIICVCSDKFDFSFCLSVIFSFFESYALFENGKNER